MYVGKVNNAPPTEQTAENSLQTANSTAKQSLSPDVRQRLFFEAQTELLNQVDELMDGASASGPIEVINDLLFHWLTTPTEGCLPISLQNPIIRTRLFRAFGLVNFLAKAYELNVRVQDEKEVNNG